MAKGDFLSPKAIGNRIKAKGLQKLRWYCQMCQKQCRDENGFKCHCMSEAHQRQMQIFGEAPDHIIESFSEQFEEAFMEHLKHSHRARVAATVVYNEFIHDRNHVHMNSTKWLTLTDFVKYLGKEGKIKVEDTPKGWFITYIDREPETVMREASKEKRKKAELAEEDRHEKELLAQLERAAKQQKVALENGQTAEDVATKELRRDEEAAEKIAFAMVGGGGLKKPADKASAENPLMSKPAIFAVEGESKRGDKSARESGGGDANGMEKGRGDTLSTMMMEQERAKERLNRKDYWLTTGIVVKVMSRALKEKGYYKMKGVVKSVIAKYIGEVEMLDSGDVLKVDQAELETVLPQIGGLVRVVNGAYRGEMARLEAIDTEKFKAKVQLKGGKYDGRTLPAIDYEDICKVASSPRG